MTTVLSLPRRKASFPVESKLPAIKRNSLGASMSSLTSSALSNTSKRSKISENDLFRRRLSDKLQQRSKRILQQKQSNTSIRRESVVDLSTSEKILEDIKRLKKRFVLSNQKRRSLGHIGANVFPLIKSKYSFARLMNRNKDTDVVEEEIEDDELPAKPRFASELSPEAQFAMMKGYEDVVYTMLHDTYPYKHSSLRRTSTPAGDVRIKKLARISPVFSDDKNLKLEIKHDKPCESSNKNAKFCKDTLYFSLRGNATKISTKEMTSSVNDQSVQTAPEKKTKFNSSVFDSVPHEKTGTRTQLTLTYRYQRAMDILDTLRKQQGLTALSPRVQFANLSDPLNAYNSWSHGWIREFEIIKNVV
jgi:hypothetical protein